VRSAAVPRLSRGDGRLYTVVRDGDDFAFAVVDPATGTLRSTRPLGSGFAWDTLQQVGTVAGDGVLWQGTVAGLIRIARR
jgi:hypothetical protein